MTLSKESMLRKTLSNQLADTHLVLETCCSLGAEFDIFLITWGISMVTLALVVCALIPLILHPL